MSDDANLHAEQRARDLIDAQLRAAGWDVQSHGDLNLFAAQGVARREAVLKPGHGRVDYLLYVDRRAVGVIEAKPVGHSLSGVEFQSTSYAQGLTDSQLRRAALTPSGRLPFVFEANGVETHFTNGYDPDPRARVVFHFPQPDTLARVIREAEADPDHPTWRAKLRVMPPLATDALRPAQVEAVEGVERSLAEQRFDRSLVQMATGAGKTYTAVTQSYRLLKHGGFHRVLFLVDRNNLADQTMAEFENYRTPGEGRRFTELYPVQKLTSSTVLDSSNVVISTIQRVYKVLNGGEVADADDPQLDGFIPDKPVTVNYNATLPPEAFDLVIVDEAHRSIYGVWRQVLEYFDAHIVGLTATPGKQTFAFFRQNLVSEYTYPQSVADGVNVDFDVYRISTQISEQGSTIDAGTIVPKVDRRTRQQRLEELEDDLVYTSPQLDRAVTSTSQIRLVLETFRDRLFTEIFPGREYVPKTLIFAKDDAHAEEIVRQVREVFGKGQRFRGQDHLPGPGSEGRPQGLPHERVDADRGDGGHDRDGYGREAVGVRVLHARCAQRAVLRAVKGRGSRTISPADFQAVTPDAKTKTRFVLVDAVGVTEHSFCDAPLNRVKGVSLEKLLKKAASLELDEDEVATLASRLAKLELDLTDREREELDEVAGRPLHGIVGALVEAVDPTFQVQQVTGAADPKQALEDLLDGALEPLASNPELRTRIVELRRTHDRTIDEVSVDALTRAEGIVDPNRARSVVESWTAYLEENRDEIAALQVLQEAGRWRVPFKDVDELAQRIQRPPHNWTPEQLWDAYEQVEAGRVKHSDRHTLTDLVSLMRFTLGLDTELVPYRDVVEGRYANWLAQQEQAGARFTVEQRWWLDNIAEVVVNSAGFNTDDLDAAPFDERGGVDGIVRDLGDRAGQIITSLNEELTA